MVQQNSNNKNQDNKYQMRKLCAKIQKELFHLCRSGKPYSYPSSCDCASRVYVYVHVFVVRSCRSLTIHEYLTLHVNVNHQWSQCCGDCATFWIIINALMSRDESGSGYGLDLSELIQAWMNPGINQYLDPDPGFQKQHP